MNTGMEKIQKSSNAALIVARICRIFCTVAASFVFVVGILLIGPLNDGLNEEIAKALQAGETMPEFDDMGMLLGVGSQLASLTDNYVTALGVYLIAVGVSLAVLAVLMHFVGKVFQDIKEGYSPFRQSVIKNMKIAFVIITLLSLNNSILIGALIGFSLWCAIYIFEYGCELQKQSDETL